MRVVLKREDRINYVISGVVLHYGLSFTTISGSCRRPDRKRRKQILIKLLRDVADVTYKEIANRFGTRPENMYIHYTAISEEIDYDSKTRKEYESIKEKLLNP